MDLVTGGAGFIGSHLVRRLLTEGRRVRVVDDLSTGDISRLSDVMPSIDFVRLDLATANLSAEMSGVGRIFHVAAVPSVPRSVREPLTAHASIATATLRLLLHARDAGVRRLVLSSSSSVYGESGSQPKIESLPAQPVSPYGVAKYASEAYARIFSSLYGMHTVNLRYFNVFGPGQDPRSDYAAVIPKFICRALANEPLDVYGDGSQTRDFTYVDNVIDANLLAADAPIAGRTYNIAAGRPRSINDLIRVLEDIVGKKLVAVYGPPRPGDIVHSHADVSAARAELGWAARVSFEEGLRHTVEWYRGR